MKTAAQNAAQTLREVAWLLEDDKAKFDRVEWSLSVTLWKDGREQTIRAGSGIEPRLERGQRGKEQGKERHEITE